MSLPPLPFTTNLLAPPFINSANIVVIEKTCRCTQLTFSNIPNITPPLPAFQSFADAFDCPFDCPLLVFAKGYAQLSLDLSAYGDLELTITRVQAYSSYTRTPIAAPPTPMKLNIWGQNGVGTDWLNGSGALFHGSVEPTVEFGTFFNDFATNIDITGNARIVLAPALSTGESYPDTQNAWIAPSAILLQVTEPPPPFFRGRPGGPFRQ